MFRSWKLGTAFGIGIWMHPSFILLPLFALAQADGLLAALMVLVGIAAAFGCVVLHELGHALTARRFGIATHDITLLPIGGVANMERMSEKPWEEFWITVAGPAVNVVIAAVLGGVLLFTGMLAPLHSRPLSIGEVFLVVLILFNLLMIGFNLVPAFPMDGGRIFRALLSLRVGRLRATEIAAHSSVFFAGLFILAGLGLLSGLHTIFPDSLQPLVQWIVPDGFQPFLIMIGLFVIVLGQWELFAVRRKEVERDLKRRGLWPTAQPGEVFPGSGQPAILVQSHQAMPVELAQPTEPNFSGFTWDAGRRAWIEWRNGLPVHICWVE